MELLGSIKNDDDTTNRDYDQLYKKLSSETFEATNRILDLCGDLKEKSMIMNNTLDIHNEQLNGIDSGLNKMDDDLNQVKNNLNYLNLSLIKSLFCCFGIRRKKCSPFKYLITKLRRKKTNNVPYIVINEDLENYNEHNNNIKETLSNKSISNLSRKESIEKLVEKGHNQSELMPKIETNSSNVKIDDNLKLIGSVIGDLQMMMAGFSQKIDETSKKIETTADKTQTTTDKVKRINQIGDSLLGDNKFKLVYIFLLNFLFI
jgi:uncharacterized phage infection (PIP) family protein YhgE